jgi:alpha-L-rhamnosidase
MNKPVNWKARWIWIPGDPSPRNAWVAMRKTFSLPAGGAAAAQMRITADSRYVLWINGTRVGRGPVRGWAWHWHYDTYDVGHLLRPGANVIAVLVLHYGVSTFQYVRERGGLLAQMDITTATGSRFTVATDRTWRGTMHPGYDRSSVRISCQQGFAELADSRALGDEWMLPGYRDTGWQRLTEIGPVGTKPWPRLAPRDIPPLTEEPVYPVRLLRTRVVKPVHHHFGFHLKPTLLPDDDTQNPRIIPGCGATVLVAPRATRAVLYDTDPAFSPANKRVFLNGKPLAWTGVTAFDTCGRCAEVHLAKGDNLLVWDFHTTDYFNFYLRFSLDIPFEPVLRAPFHTRTSGVRFATFGPIEPKDAALYDRITAAQSEEDLAPFTSYLRALAPADAIATDVFALTTQVQTVSEQPRLEDPESFLSANDAATIVYPAKTGDVELLVDFGREIVGFLEFDLEAEPGVTLDLNCFESIQDGVVDFTWGINNVLRYVSRGGRRTYHSLVRRGFRYALLVLRFPSGTRRPARLHTVRCLLNTYPYIARGTFTCSDALLNRIWEMGAYTTRLCSEDTYVDCPAYEQAFWVGDARNESLVNHVAFGGYELTRRCLLLAAESIRRRKVVESQVPSGWENILLTWSLLWVLACEEYTAATGDERFLHAVYPWVRKQNDHLERFVTSDDLLSIHAWHLLDWAGLDTPDDARYVTHLNAWFAESLRRSARMARLRGEDADARRWETLAARVAAGINAHLWDDGRKAYRDCIRADGTPSPVFSQQTNTVVYLCDCATPERKDIIAGYIADAPRGFIEAGSPFMLFFSFEALARLARHEDILAMIRRTWGMMLERGATTCWETLPGFEPNNRWTRSHCHAWSAAPTYFLSTYQLGVTVAEPGARSVRIAPQPAGLSWACGSVPTLRGPVHVDWRRPLGAFSIRVSLPEGCAASVVLPSDVPSDATVSVAELPGVHPEHDGTSWRLEIPAGASVCISAVYR